MRRRPPPLTNCVRSGPVFGFGLQPSAFVVLGADGETDTAVLARVDQGVAQLVAYQNAEEKRRKLTLILTAAGVAFAAVKLGFVAVPHFLRWKRGD